MSDEDIEMEAQRIFEEIDDLPRRASTTGRLYFAVAVPYQTPKEFNEVGNHINRARVVMGFSEEDLERKVHGWAKLYRVDYYDNGITGVLEDSDESLWGYCYAKAESNIAKAECIAKAESRIKNQESE